MKLKNSKVLVTGADGFIGSHLVELLLEKGARIHALSLYNSFNSHGWLDESPARDSIDIHSGDVRDRQQMQELTRGMDIIFHLAALIAIPYSYTAPESYIETNVKGTLNICQGALQNGCQRLIQISTSEVYGTARYVPIDESHPLSPQSPYSASKIAADAVAASFYHSFGLPVITARPFNTYGPRQSFRAIIPTIISQYLAGEKQLKLGNLKPRRDLNFVKDTVRGLVLLAECDAAVGETINIGSNTEISMADLTKRIGWLLGKKATVIQEAQRLRPKKSEVERLRCDNSRIVSLTGFAPQYPLDKGLRETIAWLQSHPNAQPTGYII